MDNFDIEELWREVAKNVAKDIDNAMADYLADPWKYAEEHRRGISDIQWARMQPMEQNYYVGDVVEFKVGGIGVITEAQDAENGWPPSYATEEVKGHPYRKDGKVAWHYEGDFSRLVAESGIRKLIIR